MIVRIDQARIRIEQPQAQHAPLRLRKDATYLVTGGISGFGLESALAGAAWGRAPGPGKWRGSRTPQCREAVSGLEALGASVRVVSCDVADRLAVQLMLAEIRRQMPPLAGVLHAAMVSDDALIVNLDAERMRKVLAPKLLAHTTCTT